MIIAHLSSIIVIIIINYSFVIIIIIIVIRSNQRVGSAFEIHVKGEINSTVKLYKFLGIESLDTNFGSWKCSRVLKYYIKSFSMVLNVWIILSIGVADLVWTNQVSGKMACQSPLTLRLSLTNSQRLATNAPGKLFAGRPFWCSYRNVKIINVHRNTNRKGQRTQLKIRFAVCWMQLQYFAVYKSRFHNSISLSFVLFSYGFWEFF